MPVILQRGGFGGDASGPDNVARQAANDAIAKANANEVTASTRSYGPYLSQTSIRARDIGIIESGDNPRQKIIEANALLTQLVTDHGGVDIRFDSGSEFEWTSRLDLPDGINLLAQGDVTFNLQAAADRMLRTQGKSSINGEFIFDINGEILTATVESQNDSQLCIEGARFISTGNDKSVQHGDCIRLGHGKAFVKDIVGTGVGTLVNHRGDSLTQNADGSRQINTRLDDPATLASVAFINHNSKNLHIDDITQTPYSDGVVGGHCISFAGITTNQPVPTIEGARLRGLHLTGREGVGWTQTAANGSSGDMVAIRSAIDCLVDDYYIADGGEFGIDVVHSCVDVTIGKGRIHRMDGSAIVVGGVNGGVVTGTTVLGLHAIDCGLDAAGALDTNDALGFSSISAIRVLNADKSTIKGCTVEGANGAGLYISNSTASPVTRLEHNSNSYTGNGTQLLGRDPVWSGQVPAFSWDGAELTYNPTTSTLPQPWTGVGNGIPSISGSGGLHAYALNRSIGWNVVSEGVVSVNRNSAKTLAYSGGTYSSVVNGYPETTTVPAQEALTFQHIDSTGNKTTETTELDNANTEESLGIIAGASNNAQRMRLYLDPVRNLFYVTYGQASYSSVTTTAVYQGEYENPMVSDELDKMILLGSVVVNTSSANFNADSAAQWLKA